MNSQYILIDELTPREDQLESMKLLFNRVSSISPLLFDKKPTEIPFKVKFPIIDENEHSVFLDECQKHMEFKDLPEFYKNKVYQAEKINFFNEKFKSFLQLKNLTEKDFSKKNPKTKLDILYDFLFSNRLDIGILDM